MTEYISSPQNKMIKSLKKLHQKKYRLQEQQFLIEGEHLVQEVLLHMPEQVQCVFLEQELDTTYFQTKHIPYYVIDPKVSASLSQQPSPPKIFATISLLDHHLSFAKISGPILFLDRIQDPGNVGTMIRTADAAGFSGVYLGLGCADLYNDKTIRATQGSLFHLPIWQGTIDSCAQMLKNKNYSFYGAVVDDTAVSYQQLQWAENSVLVMGSEGSGITKHVMDYLDYKVYIDMPGDAESLNVAVAAGILMFSMIH